MSVELEDEKNLAKKTDLLRFRLSEGNKQGQTFLTVYTATQNLHNTTMIAVATAAISGCVSRLFSSDLSTLSLAPYGFTSLIWLGALVSSIWMFSESGEFLRTLMEENQLETQGDPMGRLESVQRRRNRLAQTLRIRDDDQMIFVYAGCVFSVVSVILQLFQAKMPNF